MSQTRTSQGGSVVSFVVVGIVLVALVIGGIYLLQHRSGSPEVVKTNAPTASTSSSSAPAPSNSKTPAPSKSAQPATPAPSSSPAPTSTPVPTSAPAPENMPATGPSDMLPGGIMAAILLGLAVAYAQSRTARGRAFEHQ